MNSKYILIYILIALLAASYILGYTPLLIPVLFLVISALTFAIYYKDKAAAIKGSWRTPEKTLHILSLIGGWPGALIAQQKFRHKTQKTSFRIVFWLTLIVNISAFCWLHTHEGSRLLHTSLVSVEKRVVNNSVDSMNVFSILFKTIQ